MTDEIDCFLAEIAARPKFAAAAKADPEWGQEQLDGIGRALRALHRDGNERAFSMDLFDRVQSQVLRNTGIAMKDRVSNLTGLLAEWKPETETPGPVAPTVHYVGVS
jgi:hypothetical protein